MEQTETQRELHALRSRIHEIAEVVHAHGAKIEIGKLELVTLKEVVENVVTAMATREQVKNESAILQLKLDQVSSDVAGIKGDLKKVTLTIVIAVLMAVLGLVFAPRKGEARVVDPRGQTLSASPESVAR